MNKIKFLVLGGSAVGKTSIIAQYIDYEYIDEHITTIVGYKYIKEIEINNKKVILQIWDTAGDKIYRPLNKIFMKKSKIALIVYDITNRRSFEKLNYWIEDFKKVNNE